MLLRLRNPYGGRCYRPKLTRFQNHVQPASKSVGFVASVCGQNPNGAWCYLKIDPGLWSIILVFILYILVKWMLGNGLKETTQQCYNIGKVI
jgi:hypothetical protein